MLPIKNSMNSDLENFCDELLSYLKTKNSNSFILWVSGLSCDLIKNKPPDDYDICVFGVKPSELHGDIYNFNTVGDVNDERTELEKITLHLSTGKKVDMFFTSTLKFNEGRYIFNYGYYDELLKKDHLNPYDVSIKILESGVSYFTSRAIHILYPSMKVITKFKWLQDFNNNRINIIRKDSQYNFLMYVKLFRYASMGYEIGEKAYECMIENSKLNEIIKKEKFKDVSNLIPLEELVLVYIRKMYNQKKRGLTCNPLIFWNSAVKSGLFKYLFGQECEIKNNNNSLCTKEEMLKEIFDDEETIIDKIGQHYQLNFYDLNFAK